MPCCIINLVLGRINPGCTFLNDISFDGLRASFKNLKLASYFIERTPKRPTIIPLLLSFLSKFRVFGCQEKSHFLPIFQVVFQQFFLSKKWVDSSFIHLSISNLLVFRWNSFSSCVDLKRGWVKFSVDSKCASKEESVKLKMEMC